jgi:hypothetical protein
MLADVALLCRKITSCESLPVLLHLVVCFDLSYNISLFQTLYCFPFQLSEQAQDNHNFKKWSPSA